MLAVRRRHFTRVTNQVSEHHLGWGRAFDLLLAVPTAPPKKKMQLPTHGGGA